MCFLAFFLVVGRREYLYASLPLEVQMYLQSYLEKTTLSNYVDTNFTFFKICKNVQSQLFARQRMLSFLSRLCNNVHSLSHVELYCRCTGAKTQYEEREREVNSALLHQSAGKMNNQMHRYKHSTSQCFFFP